ncbi:MAG: NAD(P)-binding protein [Clostridia bacterium]|nr:NAD(P)-binding protein [Clostridia bacterium]
MKSVIVRNLIVPVRQDEAGTLRKLVARRLEIGPSDLKDIRTVRKSIDARKKTDISYLYNIIAEIPDLTDITDIKDTGIPDEEGSRVVFIHGDRTPEGRIAVIGAGPCGLFAAYFLAREGYRPILIERGKEISERERDFRRLKEEGILDTESNVCFGEGGAGAFSDGKLTSRKGNCYTDLVLETLSSFGAPEEIRYLQRPHLGTDGIRKVVSTMKAEIRRLGGEMMFSSRLKGLIIRDGMLRGIEYEKNGITEQIDTSACVLAIGHGARDTFEALLAAGVEMEKKPFAVGVRVEHPRELIDDRQYGSFSDVLGAASYTLKHNEKGRGIYSFCMCPGGEIVCSATEEGMTAVNGMSYMNRDGEFSDSAIVVSVKTEDLSGGVLGGVDFQRQIEKKAYLMAGGYGAPAQNIYDYIKGRKSKKLLKNSYLPYTVSSDMRELLPGFITDGFDGGFMRFDREIPGFISKGIMIGAETRTSSPVRMIRDEGLESNIRGLFPGGEGAGYAGGIVSAAADGIRIAEEIISRYRGEED